MANQLTTIKQRDLDNLTKLRDEFLQHERNWRHSRQLFLVELYEFGQKHREHEAGFNALLRERKLGFNAASDFWDKVTKVVMAQEVDGEWRLAEKSQVSKYALVLRGAEATKINPASLLKQLEDVGIEKASSQFRDKLKGTGGGQEIDYLAFFGQQSAKIAPALLQSNLQIDMDASGLNPGTVELIADVDATGNLTVKAIVPTDDAKLQPYLKRLYDDRGPLKRRYLQLFDEISGLADVVSKDCGVAIVNDKNGVDVKIVAADEAAGFRWASIISSNADLSYAVPTKFAASIEDVRKLSDLKDIKRIYTHEADAMIKSQGGRAVVDIVLRNLASFDDASEAANIRATAKEIAPVPEWIASAPVKPVGSGDEAALSKSITFAGKKVPSVSFNPPKSTVEVARDDVPATIKQAKENKGKGKAAKTVSVSITKDGITFGKGDKAVVVSDFAKALNQLKPLTERAIRFGTNDEGVVLAARKRDYEWTVFLPFVA